MIFDIINILFGIVPLILSARYEFGILNYAVGLNYTVLFLFGIAIIKKAIYNLLDFDDSSKIWVIFLSLVLLAIYNNFSLFIHNSITAVIFLRIIFILIVIGTVLSCELSYISETAIGLIILEIIIIISSRIMHRDEFKFGTIHQRYAYGAIFLYLITIGDLVMEYFYPNEYKIRYVSLPLAFNYDYQLNLFYKSHHWGYSTFIRSGFFSRLFFIVDYYEIPNTQV